MAVIALLVVTLVSQPADSGLGLADALIEHRDFYDAATEYERYLFGHPEDSLNSHVRCRLVQALARTGRMDQAQKVLALIPVKMESLVWDGRLALAEGYVGNGQSYQARAELLDLLSLTSDTTRRADVYRRLGWVDVDDADFAGAARHFKQARDSVLGRSCYSLARIGRRDPNLAALLSSFIPGSGEVYAGNSRMGIASFAVNAAVLTGTGYSLVAKHYLDAALLLTFLAGRFYFGSRNNARDLAEDHNRAQDQKEAQELRRRFASKDRLRP